MATSSIYNNIKVTDRNFCKSLASALENSQENKGKTVTYSKEVKRLNQDQVKALFNK